MKKIILIAFVLCSSMALANDVFSEEVHQCIIEEVIKQYPQYRIAELNPEWGNVFVFKEDSWTMIFMTTLDGGRRDRFFVDLVDGDTQKSSLIFLGLNLDISPCF